MSEDDEEDFDQGGSDSGSDNDVSEQLVSSLFDASTEVDDVIEEEGEDVPEDEDNVLPTVEESLEDNDNMNDKKPGPKKRTHQSKDEARLRLNGAPEGLMTLLKLRPNQTRPPIALAEEAVRVLKEYNINASPEDIYMADNRVCNEEFVPDAWKNLYRDVGICSFGEHCTLLPGSKKQERVEYKGKTEAGSKGQTEAGSKGEMEAGYLETDEPWMNRVPYHYKPGVPTIDPLTSKLVHTNMPSAEQLYSWSAHDKKLDQQLLAGPPSENNHLATILGCVASESVVRSKVHPANAENKAQLEHIVGVPEITIPLAKMGEDDSFTHGKNDLRKNEEFTTLVHKFGLKMEELEGLPRVVTRHGQVKTKKTKNEEGLETEEYNWRLWESISFGKPFDLKPRRQRLKPLKLGTDPPPILWCSYNPHRNCPYNNELYEPLTYSLAEHLGIRYECERFWYPILDVRLQTPGPTGVSLRFNLNIAKHPVKGGTVPCVQETDLSHDTYDQYDVAAAPPNTIRIGQVRSRGELALMNMDADGIRGGLMLNGSRSAIVYQQIKAIGKIHLRDNKNSGFKSMEGTNRVSGLKRFCMMRLHQAHLSSTLPRRRRQQFHRMKTLAAKARAKKVGTFNAAQKAKQVIPDDVLQSSRSVRLMTSDPPLSPSKSAILAPLASNPAIIAPLSHSNPTILSPLSPNSESNIDTSNKEQGKKRKHAIIVDNEKKLTKTGDQTKKTKVDVLETRTEDKTKGKSTGKKISEIEKKSKKRKPSKEESRKSKLNKKKKGKDGDEKDEKKEQGKDGEEKDEKKEQVRDGEDEKKEKVRDEKDGKKEQGNEDEEKDEQGEENDKDGDEEEKKKKEEKERPTGEWHEDVHETVEKFEQVVHALETQEETVRKAEEETENMELEEEKEIASKEKVKEAKKAAAAAANATSANTFQIAREVKQYTPLFPSQENPDTVNVYAAGKPVPFHMENEIGQQAEQLRSAYANTWAWNDMRVIAKQHAVGDGEMGFEWMATKSNIGKARDKEFKNMDKRVDEHIAKTPSIKLYMFVSESIRWCVPLVFAAFGVTDPVMIKRWILKDIDKYPHARLLCGKLVDDMVQHNEGIFQRKQALVEIGGVWTSEKKDVIHDDDYLSKQGLWYLKKKFFMNLTNDETRIGMEHKLGKFVHEVQALVLFIAHLVDESDPQSFVFRTIITYSEVMRFNFLQGWKQVHDIVEKRARAAGPLMCAPCIPLAHWFGGKVPRVMTVNMCKFQTQRSRVRMSAEKTEARQTANTLNIFSAMSQQQRYVNKTNRHSGGNTRRPDKAAMQGFSSATEKPTGKSGGLVQQFPVASFPSVGLSAQTVYSLRQWLKEHPAAMPLAEAWHRALTPAQRAQEELEISRRTFVDADGPEPQLIVRHLPETKDDSQRAWIISVDEIPIVSTRDPERMWRDMWRLKCITELQEMGLVAEEARRRMNMATKAGRPLRPIFIAGMYPPLSMSSKRQPLYVPTEVVHFWNKIQDLERLHHPLVNTLFTSEAGIEQCVYHWQRMLESGTVAYVDPEYILFSFPAETGRDLYMEPLASPSVYSLEQVAVLTNVLYQHLPVDSIIDLILQYSWELDFPESVHNTRKRKTPIFTSSESALRARDLPATGRAHDSAEIHQSIFQSWVDMQTLGMESTTTSRGTAADSLWKQAMSTQTFDYHVANQRHTEYLSHAENPLVINILGRIIGVQNKPCGANLNAALNTKGSGTMEDCIQIGNCTMDLGFARGYSTRRNTKSTYVTRTALKDNLKTNALSGEPDNFNANRWASTISVRAFQIPRDPIDIVPDITPDQYDRMDVALRTRVEKEMILDSQDNLPHIGELAHTGDAYWRGNSWKVSVDRRKERKIQLAKRKWEIKNQKRRVERTVKKVLGGTASDDELSDFDPDSVEFHPLSSSDDETEEANDKSTTRRVPTSIQDIMIQAGENAASLFGKRQREEQYDSVAERAELEQRSEHQYSHMPKTAPASHIVGVTISQTINPGIVSLASKTAAQRNPEEADKFSGPGGQKVVLAGGIPTTECLFDNDGTPIAVIANPHGEPSRQTITRPLIMLSGNLAVQSPQLVLRNTGRQIQAHSAYLEKYKEPKLSTIGDPAYNVEKSNDLPMSRLHLEMLSHLRNADHLWKSSFQAHNIAAEMYPLAKENIDLWESLTAIVDMTINKTCRQFANHPFLQDLPWLMEPKQKERTYLFVKEQEKLGEKSQVFAIARAWAQYMEEECHWLSGMMQADERSSHGDWYVAAAQNCTQDSFVLSLFHRILSEMTVYHHLQSLPKEEARELGWHLLFLRCVLEISDTNLTFKPLIENIDLSNCSENELEVLKRRLVKNGKSRVWCGASGDVLPGTIQTGFLPFIRVTKFAQWYLGQFKASQDPPRDPISGIQLGYMEQICFFFNGAVELYYERISHSDATIRYICHKCGIIGYENDSKERNCVGCRTGEYVVAVLTNYWIQNTQQFFQLCGLRFRAQPNIETPLENIPIHLRTRPRIVPPNVRFTPS